MATRQQKIFTGTIARFIHSPAVLDTDFYTAPIDDIKELECQMTFFNGELVFTRSPNDEQ